MKSTGLDHITFVFTYIDFLRGPTLITKPDRHKGNASFTNAM